MKKLFTILAAALFSVSMMAEVDLTEGASYDFTTLSEATFAALDSESPYWIKNGEYYGNSTSFATGTALDFTINKSGDIIPGFEGLKFINNGERKCRIYVGTEKKPQKGIYFDSGNSKLVFPGLKADQVITITYKNASSNEAGFTVTNADAVQDETNHIETLTVKEDGDVTLTYNSKKFYIETIDITAWVVPTTYVVTYVANNGEEPEEEAIDSDASKVAACAFTAPTGKSFDSWNTERDGTGTTYAVGDKVESDLTLYAQWVDLCTVTFNLQGHGDAIAEQIIEKGSNVTKPANPFTLENYAFEGWYKEAACENAWDFANDVVNTSTELYAKWRDAYYVVLYSLTDEIGSEEVTAATAEITEEGALKISDSNGRITLTAKEGATFADGDNIILVGTVGNASRPFGVKIGSQTIQTTDVEPNDPENPQAGGSAKVQGFLDLESSSATFAIGRAGGTTTTITTCIVRREVEVYAINVLVGIQHGSVSADKALAAEGEVVTLSNTPASGYKLDSYKVYKADDEETVVTVTDGKFTMPAYAVTVSGSFSVTTAVENAEAAVKAVKVVENGQLVIIKNGVKYNAQGAIVK